MLSIILPTFNEAENIAPVQELIAAALGTNEYELVYVDDSPDDTTAEAIKVTLIKDNIKLVRRDPSNRNGLLGAALVGVANATYPLVMVMDADGQHPPEIIPHMIQQINEGRDYVGGTRFLSGGTADGLNGVHRQLLSRTLRYVPKVLLGVPLSDPLTSCCMFKKERVDILHLLTLVQPGMMRIQPFLLSLVKFQSISEQPLKFGTRIAGESKMSAKSGINFLKEMVTLFNLTNAKRSGSLVLQRN